MKNIIFKIVCILFFVLMVICIPLVVNLIVLNNYNLFGVNLAGATETERSWKDQGTVL